MCKIIPSIRLRSSYATKCWLWTNDFTNIRQTKFLPLIWTLTCITYILMSCLLFFYLGTPWCCWSPRFPRWPRPQGKCDVTSCPLAWHILPERFMFRVTKGGNSHTVKASELYERHDVTTHQCFTYSIPRGIFHTCNSLSNSRIFIFILKRVYIS